MSPPPPQVLMGSACLLDGLLHVSHRDGAAGEGERGRTVTDGRCCPRTFPHRFSLPLPLALSRLPVPLPHSPPPPRPPHLPEAVRHKAVNHWIQAAVQAAQGHRDVISKYMLHPLAQPVHSDSDPEVDQHLPDVERREAEHEDHQDGGQQPDGTRPPRLAVLGHQAMAGGQEAGDAQSEAHHSQQGQEELQDGEVEEGREEHAGRAELQRCGL